MSYEKSGGQDFSSVATVHPGPGPGPAAPPPAYSTPAYGMGPQPSGYGMQPSNYGYSQPVTNVVIQQPGSIGAVRPKAPRDWNSGLCDCTKDWGICLCVWCCPLCAACQLSGDMGESMCVPCCVPGYLVALRVKMRMKENIPGSIMDDCLMSVCCELCTLCQLAREDKYVKLTDAQHVHMMANPQ